MQRPAPNRFPVLRPPPLRLVAVVALALVAGLVVHRSTARAAATAERFGSTSAVWVMTADVAPGDTIGSGDVAASEWPSSLVPAGGFTVADGPVVGRTARAALAAGEVVVASRIADGGATGAAALIPDGWRALTVSTYEAPLPVSPGDLVDVVATFDPSLVGGDPSQVVAAAAVVVEVGDDAVTVAVPRDQTTALAFAQVNGVVTLALVG